MTAETDRPDFQSPVDLAREADFSLGASRISPSTREVLRGTERETLEPRVMQVLVALFQADGRVVSRDELIARCWEGRIVGEDAINRAIGRLRRLSEVDREASFVVETIPRVGYRLRASAEGGSVGASPAIGAKEDVPPNIALASGLISHRRGWRLVAGLALFAVVACALAAWLLWPAKPSGISVAVLPFVNMSGDANQEFFSDGMTEEITSALAKVPGLTVIGRTSAFQFKGRNKDMRDIGLALGANNLIEGSVRKDGNQVRITAQLINADGTHLWTESYDRKLTDIFAVQEDIATAIASALRVPLGLKQGQSLVSNRTADTESYQDYLRAKTLLNNCGCLQTQVSQATILLEQVVAHDPNFAPAWGLLASAYGSAMKFNPVLYTGSPDELRPLIQHVYDRMEKTARNAVRLDLRSADGYAALGTLELFRGNWAAGEDYYRQALNLSPNDDNALFGYAELLAKTGRLKEAQRIQNQLLALEPLVSEYKMAVADELLANGQSDKAIRIFKVVGPPTRLARAYAMAGRYAEAADAILAMPRWPRENIEFRRYNEDAARLMRSAPAKVSAPDSLPTLWGDLGFVYLFIGAESRSLEFVERGIAANYFQWSMADSWAPPSASLRKTERFKAFVRKAHLVEYWRARGWPEFCRPVGADDFACK